MKIKKDSVRIFYGADDIISDIDDAIINALEPFGYEQYGEGYNFLTQTRDLAFDKSETE